MAERPKIPVFEGANVWRLLRTDRDGAPSADIPQTAAAACRAFLLQRSPLVELLGNKHELVPTATNEWRFGPARPFRVLAVSRSPMTPSSSGPKARLVADRQKVPGIVPSVRVESRPWFVFVQFFWRAPKTSIDFPGVEHGFFGDRYQLSGADWVLDKAWQVQDAEDPGDQTWGDAMGARARAAAASATDSLGQVLAGTSVIALLALIYLLSRK